MSLSLEWKDMDRNILTVRKSRGKITLEELTEFFHEHKQVNAFDGKIVMFMFRVMFVQYCPECGKKLYGNGVEL